LESLLHFFYITWDPDPVAFSIFGWGVRWYGIMYALTFITGFYILNKIFKAEGKSAKDLDSLTVTVIIGVIVGARLGHVFFYSDADSEYWAKPWTILYVWEGGMASHGATIGILLAIFIYSRRHPDQPYLWVSDRLSTVIGFGGVCIRLGNLINSEIVGHPATVPWAFYFPRSFGAGEEPRDALGNLIARHPVVLYEAIGYMLVFVLFLWLFFRYFKGKPPMGVLTGLFLSLLFTIRFILEFFKVKQEEYEPLVEGLTTGQLLSIPAVIGGVVIMYLAIKRHKQQALQ
jgi:prolipoprotein diacylglyceryl transferase